MSGVCCNLSAGSTRSDSQVTGGGVMLQTSFLLFFLVSCLPVEILVRSKPWLLSLQVNHVHPFYK
jgi:hypothetical protein